MVLNYTAAHSSRITKSNSKNPLLRRLSSSPFSSHPRKKPSLPSSSTSKSKGSNLDNNDDDVFSERLEDHGLITTLATDLRLRDVAQQLQYVQEHMFDSIPERAGMNSTRIAEVLNYQKNLPPIVTVAHIHALSRSPTTTEREIAELVQNGIIRKISIPGRGIGSSAIGECLVLTERWIDMVQKCTTLDVEIKNKYISALHAHPTATAIPANYFDSKAISSLTASGFLTSATNIPSSFSSLLRLDSSSLGTLASLSTAGSRAAAGSLAAVGGESAIYDAGGGGSALSSTSNTSTFSTTMELTFSLPSIGPYLRLLSSARLYFISLLSKTKYKEAPKSILQERWDGAVANTERRSKGKQGLEGLVLPAKTKKWKQFQGLRFQWVLEECVGTGAVEVFETGSVGQGLRLTG